MPRAKRTVPRKVVAIQPSVATFLQRKAVSRSGTVEPIDSPSVHGLDLVYVENTSKSSDQEDVDTCLKPRTIVEMAAYYAENAKPHRCYLDLNIPQSGGTRDSVPCPLDVADSSSNHEKLIEALDDAGEMVETYETREPPSRQVNVRKPWAQEKGPVTKKQRTEQMESVTYDRDIEKRVAVILAAFGDLILGMNTAK